MVLNSDRSFGVRANGLGLSISPANNRSVAVEGLPSSPIRGEFRFRAYRLAADTSRFGDWRWADYPNCLYRLRSR